MPNQKHEPGDVRFLNFALPLSFSRKRQLEIVEHLQAQLSRVQTTVSKATGQPVAYMHAAITEIVIATNTRLQFNPDDLVEDC